MHIVGQRGLEMDDLARCRVREGDCRGVECAAVNDGVFRGGFGIFQLPGIDGFAAIHIVGDDRVLDIGQVHANLVGPACFREEHHVGIAPEGFKDLVEGDGLLA